MNQETQFDEQMQDCAADAALYALGALPAEKINAVELRLRSGCPFCVAQTNHYAAVAEQLSLASAPVQPAPELRHKLLHRVSLQDMVAAQTANRKVVRAADAPWTKTPIPGVETRSLIGGKTFLLRMAPGAVLPQHEHPQAEQCYVLSGSVTDSDGLTLHAGDFVVMSRGMQHDPIHTALGCTLFIAYAD